MGLHGRLSLRTLSSKSRIDARQTCEIDSGMRSRTCIKRRGTNPALLQRRKSTAQLERRMISCLCQRLAPCEAGEGPRALRGSSAVVSRASLRVQLALLMRKALETTSRRILASSLLRPLYSSTMFLLRLFVRGSPRHRWSGQQRTRRHCRLLRQICSPSATTTTRCN